MIWLKKLALFCHRWMGVVFCLLFSWWFITGIFMMYWTYPTVDAAARLAHLAPIDSSRVLLSPAEAWATLHINRTPESVRLQTFLGRPAYWFRAGRAQAAVFADNGQTQTAFTPQINLQSAADWAGQPARSARVETVTEADQWTVNGIFRRNARLTKYTFPDGQEVYVSGVTGDVVQATSRSSRLAAYVSAIPHWLYFTPLRRNAELWNNIIVWSSGLATVAALLGLIAGLVMYSPSKRYRHDGAPSRIPFAGPKRLHVLFGLFFGIIACTWSFSGLMSMDPFPSLSEGDLPAPGGGASHIPEALNTDPFTFEAFAAKHPREALSAVAGSMKVRRLDFTSFSQEPVFIATEDSLHARIIPVNGGPPRNEFDRKLITTIVSRASQPDGLAEARVLDRYDSYYLDRNHALPLPVLYFRVNDRYGSRFYVDPRTAQIVGGYSSEGWSERWLYHALHSLNFPLLYNYRPAWDIVVLVLMLGGATLSITSVIIGWRFLKAKATRVKGRGREAAPVQTTGI
jgi:hypothetical protein